MSEIKIKFTGFQLFFKYIITYSKQMEPLFANIKYILQKLFIRHMNSEGLPHHYSLCVARTVDTM